MISADMSCRREAMNNSSPASGVYLQALVEQNVANLLAPGSRALRPRGTSTGSRLGLSPLTKQSSACCGLARALGASKVMNSPRLPIRPGT